MTYNSIYDVIYGCGFDAAADRGLFEEGLADYGSVYGEPCLSENDRYELEELRASGILDGFEEPEFDDGDFFTV